MKRIMVELDKCYGCLSCEAACIASHRFPDQSITNQTIMAAFTPSFMDSTRIWVEAEPESQNAVPITCRHCLEPACVEVCSIGSLSQVGENDLVINDEKRCAGCWMCIMVCPYGAINNFQKTAIKCDACSDRDSPACVEACPNQALELVEVELTPLKERERFAYMVSKEV